MKNALVKVIANHMKKSYLSWNKDTVKDDVILSIYMNYRTASSTYARAQKSYLIPPICYEDKRISNKITPPGQPKIQSNKNTKTGKVKTYSKNNNNNQKAVAT
jgi:hypothetical protein